MSEFEPNFNENESEKFVSPKKKITDRIIEIKKIIDDAGGWLNVDQNIIVEHGLLLNELDKIGKLEEQ